MSTAFSGIQAPEVAAESWKVAVSLELAKEKDQRRILADDVKRLETQQAVSSKQRE